MTQMMKAALERSAEPVLRMGGFRPERIDKVLGSLGPSVIMAPSAEEILGVAAVSRALGKARDVDGYIRRMDQMVAHAVSAGSRLVVFPEHNGLDLLFAGGVNAEEEADPVLPPKRMEWVSAVLRTFGARLQPWVSRLFSSLAARHDAYVFSGTFPEWDPAEERMFNTGWLFDPSGRVVLRQRKLQLSVIEQALGFSRGREVPVGRVDAIPTACVIGTDAEAFEPFRIARDRGAILFLMPAALLDGEHAPVAQRCGWSQVLSVGGVGIRSVLVGRTRHFRFSGSAALWGPYREDGMIMQAEGKSGEYLVCASIDREGIEMCAQVEAYRGDRNVEFEAQYANWYRTMEARG